jgi:hypothetical protein
MHMHELLFTRYQGCTDTCMHSCVHKQHSLYMDNMLNLAQGVPDTNAGLTRDDQCDSACACAFMYVFRAHV